jgi:SAM-dependent methyltransferase
VNVAIARSRAATAINPLSLASDYPMNASTAIPNSPSSIDMDEVKQRQQTAWASGNYAVVGTTLQIVGEMLCEALDLRSGEKVLDVAAGNGNATLAAARRWCEVTSTDYVASLLDQGKARSAAEGARVDFQIADAENLPFAAESFDVVLSTFGVMFAPDQTRAASELLRVCRRGGRIGLANWTPESFVGQLFKTIGRHVPPPVGVKSPALWGTVSFLQEHFGNHTSIATTRRTFVFRYRSPEHFVDVFSAFYGPVHKVFGALDEESRKCLRADIIALIGRYQNADARTMAVDSEYLEIILVKK